MVVWKLAIQIGTLHWWGHIPRLMSKKFSRNRVGLCSSKSVCNTPRNETILMYVGRMRVLKWRHATTNSLVPFGDQKITGISDIYSSTRRLLIIHLRAKVLFVDTIADFSVYLRILQVNLRNYFGELHSNSYVWNDYADAKSKSMEEFYLGKQLLKRLCSKTSNLQ